MQKISYASTVRSLMYAQVCTRPDIAFVVGVLGRYLSNPRMQHWNVAKCVMCYLKRTKGYMLDVKIVNVPHLIHIYVGWRSYLLEVC